MKTVICGALAPVLTLALPLLMLGGAQAETKVKPQPPAGAKPEYFVVHCAAMGSLGGEEREDKFWEKYVKRKLAETPPATNRGYGFITPKGTFVRMWPFNKRDVDATKTESCKETRDATYGRFINIEVGYWCGAKTKKIPDSHKQATTEQYKKLADVYVEVHNTYGPLTIVSHKEVDRGLNNGHGDPYGFDFNVFYAELGTRGLDMTKIPRMSQTRHAMKTGPEYKHNVKPQLDGPLVREDKNNQDDCKSYPTPKP